MDHVIGSILRACGDYWWIIAAALVTIRLIKPAKGPVCEFNPKSTHGPASMADNAALKAVGLLKGNSVPVSVRRQAGVGARPSSTISASRLVTQACTCAVSDLPFLDRFERQASGFYRPVESLRIHASNGPFAGAYVSVVLNVDDIDGPYMPCPWCRDDSNMRYHCDCGVVCGGKVRRGVFHCRPSCGLSWVGGPVDEIEVATEGKRGGRQAPAKQTNVSRLLPPGKRG